MSDQPTIQELIEASSLGTPEAKAARESVPMEKAQEIVRRARELGARSLEDRLLDVLRQAYLHGYVDTCIEDVSEHHADEHLLDLMPLLDDDAAEPVLDLEYLERLTAERDQLLADTPDLRSRLKATSNSWNDLANRLHAADARVAQLTEALEDARRLAGFIEGQNAAALALHQPSAQKWFDGTIHICMACDGIEPYPCPTARALGVEPAPELADHPHADPGDGRQECQTCGKWVWLVTHSCKGVPVTPAALACVEDSTHDDEGDQCVDPGPSPVVERGQP